VNYQGGHGSMGGTETDLQEKLADVCSFLLWQFGLPGFQPVGNAAGSRDHASTHH